ncbi:MAG: RNA methyltransferase [Chloroherpetonaceae bacterium]|nr:RNA methyltransferase [Chloroherpetonaceae bacterium]
MKAALSLAKRKVYSRLSEKKFRLTSGLFLAEGERTVMQLVSNLPSPDFLEAIILRETSPESIHHIAPPAKRFHLENIPNDLHSKVYWATKDEFDLIATTEEPQFMIGIFREPKWVMEAFLQNPNRSPFIVALDGVQDPGNAGTILRTAAWFRATGVIGGEGTVDFYNPKTVRSSAGALYSIPNLRVQNLEETVKSLKQNGYKVYAADMHGEAYRTVSIEAKSLLVIGNEGNGISETILSQATRLSISGDANAVESLNAGVSAAILIAHFARAY